jgi:G:T-mismatch repair DNA endonuclease (very short patch repair protein)
MRKLMERGFAVIVVWECEVERSPALVEARVLAAFQPLYS